ncbi:DUF2167 domain-containing protein [Brevibacillus dissolubilis]|uniref:DUF2167 domain-containing protein n=1 Tax=Brevibacillus dissolubilis TaxID=1844116 RepID=UPI001115C430|nr:DUF2167 domain-containing protein [Brevibacillus dissolubilis]
MKKISFLPFLLSFALFLGLVTPISAEEELNWVEGGQTVELGDNLATLDLAPELLFLNKEDTIKLEEQNQDTPTGLELASIFPAAEDQDWAVFVEYEEVGYIRDEDQNEIDADAILADYKEGTEEANKDRNPEDYLHVVGWDVKPTYDKTTHRLEWSMLAEDAQKNPVINYNVRMLTRKGYLSFILVSDPANLAQDKEAMKNLIFPALKVKEGNRYEDFNEATDAVAEYGLTGLILGGLGLAVAKKAGLLAILLVVLKKGWVFILLIGGALLKFGKKLFGRKKAENVATPVETTEFTVDK